MKESKEYPFNLMDAIKVFTKSEVTAKYLIPTVQEHYGIILTNESNVSF